MNIFINILDAKSIIIGRAENAIVYMAKEIASNEDRAIKIYKKKKISAELYRKNYSEPTEKEMKPYIDGIFNEINYMKMISSYENKNTVKYYEYFHTNDELAIVMELCDGQLLNYFNSRNDISGYDLNIIKGILNQLNNSFRIMAEMNLVHRALNLQNILIKNDKKMSDFIIKLKLTDDCILLDDLKYNKNHKIKNNPQFIAPEILKEEEYNQNCDLWSLGVIIYVLIFKKYPYNGNTSKSILNQIKDAQLEKTNDEDLDDLIQNLLIENPKDRLIINILLNYMNIIIRRKNLL